MICAQLQSECRRTCWLNSTSVIPTVFVKVKQISRNSFFLLVMGVLLALPVQAQELGRLGDVQASGTSYHVFARPGEATVQVLVYGNSGGGIYEVGAETKLDEFLALIGGAPGFGSSTGRKVRVTIQLYREQEGSRTLVYEERMEQMVTEPGQYPRLQEGDVFVVEVIERNRIGWRDVLSVVTGVSSVILLASRISTLLD